MASRGFSRRPEDLGLGVQETRIARRLRFTFAEDGQGALRRAERDVALGESHVRRSVRGQPLQRFLEVPRRRSGLLLPEEGARQVVVHLEALDAARQQ